MAAPMAADSKRTAGDKKDRRMARVKGQDWDGNKLTFHHLYYTFRFSGYTLSEI